MAPAIRRLDFGSARPDDHIELLGHQLRNHRRCDSRFVGRVAIGHDIYIGFDIGEHPADDIALALHPFGADNGPRRRGDIAGPVGRIIVVNIDFGVGQNRAKSRHSRADGSIFVVAWQQHGNLHLASPCPIRGCAPRPSEGSPP